MSLASRGLFVIRRDATRRPSITNIKAMSKEVMPIAGQKLGLPYAPFADTGAEKDGILSTAVVKR